MPSTELHWKRKHVTLTQPGRTPGSAADQHTARAWEGVAGQLLAAVRPFLGGAEPPVRLRCWDGSLAGPPDAPVLVVRSPNALRRLLAHPGELGLAQAYVTGEIDVEGDLLTGLRRVWAAGRDGVRRTMPGPTGVAAAARTLVRVGALGLPPQAPVSQARLRGRLHTRGRDQAAIAHHYDLSNQFYSLILEPHMAYSCGYWTSADPAYTVHDAQTDKLDLVARKLGLGQGTRLLDIGCGWGSMSLYAAEHFGAHVVGVTLSEQQRDFVQRRITERGLGDRVQVRLQDYREVCDGPFDAVVSLEMGEHVGRANYPRYVQQIRDLMRPGGRALIQQMSRRTRPGGGPFIEAFIAPDMYMRPVGQTVALIEDGGLEVRDVHALREHYVRTIRAWYDTFEANWDKALDLVGEQTARVWRLYLVGGALSFEQGRMGVDQILAVRPDAIGTSHLPWVRQR